MHPSGQPRCKFCNRMLASELGAAKRQWYPGVVHETSNGLSLPPALAARKRWRLWDIHRGIHGALLALSFTPDELRRLVRRAGVSIPTDARYYDIHRHLCEACISRGTLSELVEKALDQKFATKILMLRGIRSGEVLEERWGETWRKGRGLAALFWAFLAHPCANEEIRAGFYADVHALFFAALGEREKLLERVDDLEHRNRALEKRRRQEVEVLQQRLERELARSVEARTKPSASIDDTALKLQVTKAAQRAARAEARVHTLEERLRQRSAPPRASEIPRLPQFAIAEPAGSEASCDAATPGQSNNVTVIMRVTGVHIAYVGGRPGPLERIRDFIEKRGARFLHHDGGLEESPVRLDQLLQRADVVFYPVDCISHEAAVHLKAHCKRTETPAIPLRNASISAFRRAIKSWCGLT